MSEKKKISIMVPCYNEEENVVPLSEAAIATLEKDLPEYDYEILFIDNCSKDKTREKLIFVMQQKQKRSKQFLIQRISDSLIHLIMVYVRQQEIVLSVYVQIFRTQLI